MAFSERSPFDPVALSMDEDDRARLARMVLGMRARSVRDPRLLSAIEQMPRRLFLPAIDRARIHEDRPIAIACGQVTTAPSDLAVMLMALAVEPQHTVLDIGTGSGYAAAVLGRLAARVITLDRYRTLVDLAQERLASLKLANVTAVQADGLEGFARHAPYDRILVTGSVEAIPERWLEQMPANAILVVAVGPAGGRQDLLRILRTDRGTRSERIGQVRFVALQPGRAQAT